MGNSYRGGLSSEKIIRAYACIPSYGPCPKSEFDASQNYGRNVKAILDGMEGMEGMIGIGKLGMRVTLPPNHFISAARL